MTTQNDRIEEICGKLLDSEREILWERRGTPLFQGPMDTLRAIKERYKITWRELRAVMYSM